MEHMLARFGISDDVAHISLPSLGQESGINGPLLFLFFILDCFLCTFHTWCGVVLSNKRTLDPWGSVFLCFFY
jgi:hypothetical protein